jgi:redox-sensitive bicupin YhaK (pirin superfamily)
MITRRPARERGHTNLGWLDSWHTFSFGHYHDSRFVGFRVLRVINEDRVEPAAGFGTHPHSDMEILSYVLDGALEHKDSMGDGSVIRPGDVQRMTAGTGVRHSERNPSRTERAHFLQIWILPQQRGLTPAYEQRTFGAAQKRGVLLPVATADGRANSVRVQQDVSVFASLLGSDVEVVCELAPGRFAWLQAVSGPVALNGERLEPGDGAAVEAEARLRLRGLGEPGAESEVLIFDLP